MTDQIDSMPALDQLCEALDVIGDALADVDLDRMLAAEPRLRGAMAALATSAPLTNNTSTTPGCERAKAALLRCRRLGASFSRAARTLTGVGTVSDAYDKSGAHVDSAALRAVLQVRI
jgi:hypothetical protein